MQGLHRDEENAFCRPWLECPCTFLLGAVPAKGAVTAGEAGDGWRLSAVGKEQHLGPGRGDGEHLP